MRMVLMMVIDEDGRDDGDDDEDGPDDGDR